VALAHLEQGRPLSAREVVTRLHHGGHQALARMLAVALARGVRWDGPTALQWQAGVTVARWRDDGTEWAAGLAEAALAARDAWLEQRAPDERGLLVVHADGQALANTWVAEALTIAAERGRPAGLALWVVSGSASTAIWTRASQALAAALGRRMALADPAAEVGQLMAMGWSEGTARAIQSLPAGAAAMRDAGGVTLVRPATSPGWPATLTAAVASAALVASA
jgi:hypothetical protein